MRTLYTYIMLVFLVGCSANTVFVVLRDVPNNPSFVVVPANDFLYQVEFANTVESYLLSSGVKVVARPATKEVQATKQAAQAEAQSTQTAGTQATVTEKYHALDETAADYFVETYADTKQIKIIRKSTKEILVSFVLKRSEKQKEDQIIRETLRSLGVLHP